MRLPGTAVSPGIAHGLAYVLEGIAGGPPAPYRSIAPEEVEGELARFDAALARAEGELIELQASMAARVGAAEAQIFVAHAMLVRSPSLHRKVGDAVREKRINVEAALGDVIGELAAVFDEIREESLRQRRADIRDIGRRILSALLEEQGGPCSGIPPGSILVTDELRPSITAHLDLCRVSAVVTERGGRFGHAAILARANGTPAVSGVRDATARIRTGDALIVDAVAGTVFVSPTPALLAEFEALEAEMDAFREELRQLVDQPSVTLDGTPITLLANVGSLAEAETALLYGAPGIGLCRTEVGFASLSAFPTEDEQYDLLSGIVRRMQPHPVNLRLLDVGGDKRLDYWPLPVSPNPALARHGVRLLLDRPEILRLQLRVFLRLSAEHDVRILIPGVGGVEEVIETCEVVRQVRAELSAEGIPTAERIPLGAMIELPSAALLASSIAEEVDFLSLGSNDLVQYLLAADRDHEDSAAYYRPLHPAVLALVGSVVSAAAAADRPLGICGEIAGEPAYTELLVGLGLRELSVAPGDLLAVRHAVRTIDVPEAEALAREVLSLRTADEIEALLARRGARLLPPALSSARRYRSAGAGAESEAPAAKRPA
jgi:phosphoenolpyruvate-protein phosphotransferase (PTS system enzyme I)